MMPSISNRDCVNGVAEMRRARLVPEYEAIYRKGDAVKIKNTSDHFLIYAKFNIVKEIIKLVIK